MFTEFPKKNKHIPVKSAANSQQGFTLIELLVSIALGVLISAAVIQVFVTSQRVDGVQRSGSEIQNSSIFGLQSIERQIRFANLGNDGRPMSDTTPNGGIVLTTHDGTNANLTDINVIGKTTLGNQLDNGYLTVGGSMSVTGGNNIWKGTNTNTTTASGAVIPSDQLTLQYKNEITATTGMKLFDCAGANIANNERVIQRYYLAERVPATTPAIYDLMCQAGRVIEVPNPAGGAPTYQITGFGQGHPSVVVINNVDQFNIRLGLSRKERLNPADVKETITYYDMSIEDYLNITGNKPFITSIRMAVLARGSSNSPEEGSKEFMIFGQKQKLKSTAQANVLRRVFETTVLLRNARVMEN